jgi:UDP-glucose 4-epimerase
LTKIRPKFVHGDVANLEILDSLFQTYKIDTVFHFAGLKSVKESEELPLKYYWNNVLGTINLLEVMNKNGVKNLIFSSSATVYGKNKNRYYTEFDLLNPDNNYGKTKKTIEDFLESIYKSDRNWNIVILRYFNPAGAHPSGLIGENPRLNSSNLFPSIGKVISHKSEKVFIFGNNYDTSDGFCKRDFIHIQDLATGHVKAFRKALENKQGGLINLNLGTGRTFSVWEVLKMFEKVTNQNIPYIIMPRREGDLAEYGADIKYSQSFLGWVATKGLEEMCTDTFLWLNNKEIS